MKKLSILFFVLTSFPCFGQAYPGSVFQNSPGNYARIVPYGEVEICTSSDTGTPCSLTPLATTYTDATLTTACTQSTSSGVLSGAPTSGTGCNNPGIADANGNFQLYLAVGTYRLCTYSQNWICQNFTLGSGSVAVAVHEFEFSTLGQPAAGQIVGIYTVAVSHTFPANFASPNSVVTCGTNPTATAVYTVLKNGSAVGTLTLSTSCGATWSSSGFTVAPGDRLTITAPLTQDATLANVGITLVGQ